MDVQPLHHGRFLVDFNYAYNPYCAYNPNWSCPIPPTENRLNVAIDAGIHSARWVGRCGSPGEMVVAHGQGLPFMGGLTLADEA